MHLGKCRHVERLNVECDYISRIGFSRILTDLPKLSSLRCGRNMLADGTWHRLNRSQSPVPLKTLSMRRTGGFPQRQPLGKSCRLFSLAIAPPSRMPPHRRPCPNSRSSSKSKAAAQSRFERKPVIRRHGGFMLEITRDGRARIPVMEGK